MSIERSMLLTTSEWESENNKVQCETFRLIPITTNCPFREGFYDPEVGVLVLMAKDNREQFTTMPRINEYGLEIFKRKKALVDQHRVQLPVEHIIKEPKEIKDFLTLFAFNVEVFEFQKYLDGPVIANKRRENISAATL